MEISFFKNQMKIFQNTIDLCDKSKKKLGDIANITLSGFGIPAGCPIAESYVMFVSDLNCILINLKLVEKLRKWPENIDATKKNKKSFVGCVGGW